MTFAPGDIVVIERHFLQRVVGRSAEIQIVFGPERAKEIYPLLGALAPGQFWYVLIDIAGEKRCAPHPWLRPAAPVPFNTRQTREEIGA